MVWKKRPESAEFRKIKAEIRRRDKNTCQLCNKKCYAKNSHVHHIQTYSDNVYLRDQKTNLIVLCKVCHQTKVTGSEIYYSVLFSKKAFQNQREQDEK